MFRYLLRFILFFVIFWFAWSILSVAVLRFMPVTITPLKVVRLFENFDSQGLKVRSKWRPIEKIDESMIRAVIAAEDNNFMEHSGIDYDAVKKAIDEHKRGKPLRGASTISQQTAKNVFCLPYRWWTRKAMETYYTFLIEVIWGKKRIMEVYLNVIETGPNMYGVEATANRVYRKKADALNLYEASMIASVLPNPLVRDLKNPSTYVVSRAAKIRANMRNLPPVEMERFR